MLRRSERFVTVPTSVVSSPVQPPVSTPMLHAFPEPQESLAVQTPASSNSRGMRPLETDNDAMLTELIRSCTKSHLRQRIIHSPVFMGCNYGLEGTNRDHDLEVDVDDQICVDSPNKHRRTEVPSSLEPHRPMQGECESARAPRPMKRKQRSLPDSPRAPRPWHYSALTVHTSNQGTDAIDTAEILTQVSRGPPSPGVSSRPVSPELSNQQISSEGPLLLPPRAHAMEGRRTLCLDLDECLVHAEREVR